MIVLLAASLESRLHLGTILGHVGFTLSCLLLLTLVIAGKGFIRVESPTAWDLRGGYPVNDTGSETEEYCISMFHQLHCLVRLLSRYTKFASYKT